MLTAKLWADFSIILAMPYSTFSWRAGSLWLFHWAFCLRPSTAPLVILVIFVTNCFPSSTPNSSSVESTGSVCLLFQAGWEGDYFIPGGGTLVPPPFWLFSLSLRAEPMPTLFCIFDFTYVWQIPFPPFHVGTFVIGYDFNIETDRCTWCRACLFPLAHATAPIPALNICLLYDIKLVEFSPELTHGMLLCQVKSGMLEPTAPFPSLSCAWGEPFLLGRHALTATSWAVCSSDSCFNGTTMPSLYNGKSSQRDL